MDKVWIVLLIDREGAWAAACSTRAQVFRALRQVSHGALCWKARHREYATCWFAHWDPEEEYVRVYTTDIDRGF